MYMTNIPVLEAHPERRRKPRISEPFIVKVRGKDALGENFELDAVIDNLSSTGVFLQLPLDISFGAKVSMLIRLSTAHTEDREVAKVSVEAMVVRKELVEDEIWGVAFKILKRRFV
jgi:hypothetical protein